MDENKQNELFNKYPEIFQQRHLPMTVTAMCWGIECGNGWYDVLDSLCGSIMIYCEKSGATIPQFTQVKEKMGSLRVYCNYYDDQIVNDLISLAEHRSTCTCDICSAPGEIEGDILLSCRCSSCRKKQQ